MTTMTSNYDCLIIGAGIIGLSLAYEYKRRFQDASVLIVDKEDGVARHASGRNSGVLHAGFYYTADSLKARFTVAGNRALRSFCEAHNLALNDCGKLVVALDEAELERLHELKERGDRNGSRVELVSLAQAREIEPNIVTHQKALWSPNTATVDPVEVCEKLKEVLAEQKVEFRFNTAYLGPEQSGIRTSSGLFTADLIINAAGLYADRIARDYGYSKNYTIIPFKGLYLKYTKNTTDVQTNIYPVPDLRNPFLGVHFTKTVDDHIKIGPTAIPAFARENYSVLSNLRGSEVAEILGYETRLFLSNAFNFRNLAISEIKKYWRPHLVHLAAKMVRSIDPKGFTEFTAPGIRSQLLNKQTLELVQDFVVEGEGGVIHILNAVSPAFTCCFPFAEYVLTECAHVSESEA